MTSFKPTKEQTGQRSRVTGRLGKRKTRGHKEIGAYDFTKEEHKKRHSNQGWSTTVSRVELRKLAQRALDEGWTKQNFMDRVSGGEVKNANGIEKMTIRKALISHNKESIDLT